MNKQVFLAQLSEKLSHLPKEEVTERLTFYSEMIDDRMEEGLSEEEAVRAIGLTEELFLQMDLPTVKSVKELAKRKCKWKAWEIVLLVLSAPLWVSLLIVALAVIFSLYVSLWSVIVSLWSVFASAIGCSIGSIATGVSLTCSDNGAGGITMLGAGILCAGIAIFLFYGCQAATKGVCVLTKKISQWIKGCLVRKGETVWAEE